ncbi:hypothetical protein HOG16_02590 [Candidatus Woesearchaeota archaeon]|jgi:hypothetical protein|nr:hypothetical protein [Candidatus Woesearchaeota archaeon]MBT4321985.1 hypothetical protein [Candidatus Woesearchaeota archaeon]MBT4630731.1 hypothetical protein [Candidatus Woesearchaeota archaeon]
MKSNKNLLVWGVGLIVLSLILGFVLSFNLFLHIGILTIGFGMVFYGLLDSSKGSFWKKGVMTILAVVIGLILAWALVALLFMLAFSFY